MIYLVFLFHHGLDGERARELSWINFGSELEIKFEKVFDVVMFSVKVAGIVSRCQTGKKHKRIRIACEHISNQSTEWRANLLQVLTGLRPTCRLTKWPMRLGHGPRSRRN